MKKTTVQHRQYSTGLSLVEVMIAMTVGLLLLAGVVSLLVNNKTVYTQVEQRGRLQENLRFAMDKLSHDLRMTNYRGCRNEGSLDTGNGIQAVAGTNSTDPDRLLVRYRVPPTMRYTNLAGDTLELASNHGLSDGDTFYLESCGSSDWLEVEVDSIAVDTPAAGTDTITLTTAPAGLPEIGWFHPLEYNDDSDNDGIVEILYYLEDGALKMVRDAADTTATGGQPLVGGDGDLVENMQLMFGIDTDNDQIVNSYIHPESVTNWNQVMSVRVALLLATEEHGQNELDTSTYALLGVTIDPADERRQRKVVETTIQLRNMLSGL